MRIPSGESSICVLGAVAPSISSTGREMCIRDSTSSLSSGFHPQTNGQTEWANQQLERFLRCFAGEHQRSWARYLVWAELSNNIHTSSATNLSPFEVCYGYQPPVFEHQEPEVDVPSAQELVLVWQPDGEYMDHVFHASCDSLKTF
ncbi:Retrotransposable element Tf2 type 1 [Labeo rohita]|uniref:Retrotransposable element Tf2 type 1 n=1 Tax=Labeo rohita TaxID=84645 RepID=A0A498NMJ2_LABRO|nr:Retrotransposable element Tf2 type 1 [Labeo rohita]